MTLGVSSEGAAEATEGNAEATPTPATPPMMEATLAKDSLREMSVLTLEEEAWFMFIPANPWADWVTASAAMMERENFIVRCCVGLMRYW